MGVRLLFATIVILPSATNGLNWIISPTIPLDLARTSRPLSSSFNSFSIEFNDLPWFGGNATHPNTFTYNLLASLAFNTGNAPAIRVGGSTQDRATLVSDQTEPIRRVYPFNGADQPDSITIGPGYFTSMLQFPPGTAFIFGLNFDRSNATTLQQHQDNLVAEANAALTSIGRDLVGFEIGNEPDLYPGKLGRGNTSIWTVAQYVHQWLEDSNLLAQEVLGGVENDKAIFEPFFYAGSFASPSPDTQNGTLYNNNFSSVATLEAGINRDNRVKAFMQHEYFYGQNSVAKKAVISLQGLMNHTLLKNQSSKFIDSVKAYDKAGIQFIIGETNSITSQGLDGVSNVFGSAIWLLDHLFYLASINVSQVFSHQGAQYRYSSFQPIAINSTAPNVRPAFYANQFVTTAIGRSDDIRISEYILPNYSNSSQSAYVLYDHHKLKKFVLLDSNVWNATSPGVRPKNNWSLDISGVGMSYILARVERLRAAGADSRGNETSFSGRKWSDVTGLRIDDGAEEEIAIGRSGWLNVTIEASEAVLVTLHY